MWRLVLSFVLFVPLLGVAQNDAQVGEAAGIFSLIPPTGSTFPRKVISPVMASFDLTFLCV